MKIGFQGDIYSNAEEATEKFVKKQTNCEKLRKKETSIIKDVFV